MTTKEKTASFLTLGSVAPIAMLLSACGGGGDAVTTSSGEIPADLVGQTLPYYAVDGDNRTDRLFRGDGSTMTVRVVDRNTIEFTTSESGAPTTSTFRFDAASGAWLLDGAPSSLQFRIVNRGDYQAFFLSSEPGNLAISPLAQSGGFGRPTDIMPGGTATYSSNSFSRILIADDVPAPGDPPYSSISGAGVNLTADFSNATVSGTVFDGSALFDLNGDTVANDRLGLRVNMAATISGNSFTGTVSSGGATVDINDDGRFVSNQRFTLTNTDADGAFFNDGAQWVAGTWEGDFELFSGSNINTATGDMIGFFEAQAD
jgi:hypothetical protein